MAGLYSMRDLLDLVEREGGQELWLHVGKPPLMVLRGQMRALDEVPLTKDNTTELLRSVATADQIRELQQCGDIHFIYLSQNSARFGVTAAMQHEEISLKMKNLTR
jgi:Tfp pilus assembly ATPase PilU